MKKALIALIALATAGCSTTGIGPGGESVSDGAAVYQYHKDPNGACDVSATSSRAPTGITVLVDKDCALTIQTDMDPDKQMQIQMLEMAHDAVRKLP